MTKIKNQYLQELRSEHRWRLIKRKKLVLNCCMNMLFTTALVSASAVFSPVMAADLVPGNTLPTGVTTEVGTNVTHNTSVDGRTLDIGMNTNNYVKERWDSFSIGRNATVNINGNSGSTYVGRVISGNASEIYGKLNGAGINVFLMNTAGITFHGGSQVNVGSLLATTAGDVTKNGDQLDFIDFGNAYVINSKNAKITVSEGGTAILAAPYVENAGTIKADLGNIKLASTKSMTLDLRGDGLITYEVTPEALENAGVKNSGTLRARSGTIDIEAKNVSTLTDSVVNLEGVVDADSFEVGRNGGTILISSTGDVNINGAIVKANGRINGDGGNVYISAENDVNFDNGAKVSVNGGSIGNGGDVLVTAENDINFNNVEISANAGFIGTGGFIVTKAGGLNNFSENAVMSAKGGSVAGDAGLIEISGNDILVAGSVDLTAVKGKGGKFFVDPAVIAIKNGSGAGENNVLYEQFIENLSQNDVDVILRAKNSIVMEDLADNQLQGGGGDFNFKVTDTNGSISSVDKNDTIVTTYGNIILIAGQGGIDVGSLQTSGSKLHKNFGAVYLKTLSSGEEGNGDIITGDINIAGENINPEGNAGLAGLVAIKSAGKILVDGNLSVSVSGSGQTNSIVLSSAYLMAGDDINVTGNISISAGAALDNGSGESRAIAKFRATSANGNINLTGDEVSVTANGNTANGVYDVLLAKSLVALNAGGNVSVSGNLNVDSNSGSEAAYVTDINAQTNIDINSGGMVSLANIDAGANSGVVGGADANANAAVIINAIDNITISGNTSVTTTADVFSGEGNADNANSGSILNIDSDEGSVSVNGVTVNSTANSAQGNAEAIAAASINATDGDVRVAGLLTVDTISQSNSIASATSTAVISAADDIVLSNLVADPRVSANNALVQQRFSGTDFDLDSMAVLTLSAGGEIRFEPANNGGGENNGGGNNDNGNPNQTVSNVGEDIDITNLGGFGSEQGDLEEEGGSSGLNNLAPAGGDNDCDFMNCTGPAV